MVQIGQNLLYNVLVYQRNASWDEPGYGKAGSYPPRTNESRTAGRLSILTNFYDFSACAGMTIVKMIS